MRMKKSIGGIPKINSSFSSSFVVVLIVVVSRSGLAAAIDGLDVVVEVSSSVISSGGSKLGLTIVSRNVVDGSAVSVVVVGSVSSTILSPSPSNI